MRVIKYVESSSEPPRPTEKDARHTKDRLICFGKDCTDELPGVVLVSKRVCEFGMARPLEGAVLICLREQFGWIGIFKSRNTGNDYNYVPYNMCS